MIRTLLGLALITALCAIATVAQAAESLTQGAASHSIAIAKAAAAPALRGDDGWATAVHAQVGWDFTHGRVAQEPADVAVIATDRDLYVRFTVAQHAPITATQSVDDAGEGSDDEVFVYLWPSGKRGFLYTFSANPRGTHYQSSTENATYAPTWQSTGSVGPSGYAVTMRIPLRALRADGSAVWNAQFERAIHVDGEHDVWTHGDGMTSTNQVTYAGSLAGMGGIARAARAKPRLGVYGLAEGGDRLTGGSTSRAGADVSIPVTATASLVATFHPDFSNVEADQQTIAPTTFRRAYNEVRPFFAQGATFYDNYSCYGCPGNVSELYTPAIPTPKRGYQLEGKQGSFGFGVLDAVGDGRIDDAQALSYSTPDKVHSVSFTRVAAEQPRLHDITDFVSYQFNSQHGWIGYANEGIERGTQVTDPHQGRKADIGIAYAPRDTFIGLTTRHIGSQYNPVDGFVAVNDLAGYSAQASQTKRWSNAPVQSAQLGVFVDHYAGADGFGTNLYDANVNGNLFLRNKVSLAYSVGSSYYRVPGDAQLHPANQQGPRIDYLLGTATQSTLNYNTGRFGNGRLTSLDRMLGFRVARRFTVSTDAYSTTWHGDDGGRNVQWLERGSVAVDVGPRSSLTFGARRIIGTNPPFPGQPAAFTNASNLSFGFSSRRQYDDLYVVYGDASALSTRPSVTLKLVHYFGAEKGT